MSRSAPRLLVAGDTRHGVNRLAEALRDEVLAQQQAGSDDLPAQEGVHVHFTDRLYGRSAAEAADWFEHLASTGPVTVTLHDLPQASDGTAYDGRAAGYRRVVRAARAVVCNSRHESLLLADLVDDVTATVIPLPVQAPALVGSRPEPAPEAAVLGFFYPGKGHAEVARALAELPEPRLRLLVLGCASDGHEDELAAMLDAAAASGVSASVTGYLSEEAMLERSRRVAVPVVAHEHVSASGSLNSWLAAGRRPLVRDSRYAREMAALRPGSCTVYPRDDLAGAVAAASADPGSTWLSPGTDLRPDLADVAGDYRTWWRDQVRW